MANQCDLSHLSGCLVSGVQGVVGIPGAVVGQAITSGIDAWVQSVAKSTEQSEVLLATVWMKFPSPQIADVNHHANPVISAISQDLSMYTILFAMFGLLITAGKMALNHRGEDVRRALYMIGTLVVITGAAAGVVGAFISAGDAFAPWIIAQATGQPFTPNSALIVSSSQIMGQGSGPGLFVAIACWLGSCAQILFMLFRAAMITLLMCILPTIAATTVTQGGSAALRKAIGWLIAFVLYKPVAAVVYAVGFMLMHGDGTAMTGDPTGLWTLLVGTLVILMAALTLPALIKFLVPMASAGASSMFSGAAVGAAALAAGAAVVTMGVGAGVGAGAGAGAGAAKGGGGAVSAAKSGAGAAPAGASPAAAGVEGSSPAAAGSSPGKEPPAGSGAPAKDPASSGGEGAPQPQTSPGSAQGAGPAGGGKGGGSQKWRDAAKNARTAADGARKTNEGIDESGVGPTGAPSER
jgi:type IV secretion system protein TrbL